LVCLVIFVWQSYVCTEHFVMPEDVSYAYSVIDMWYLMNPCMIQYIILIAYGYQSGFSLQIFPNE
jgi:hypothetical protein